MQYAKIINRLLAAAWRRRSITAAVLTMYVKQGAEDGAVAVTAAGVPRRHGDR